MSGPLSACADGWHGRNPCPLAPEGSKTEGSKTEGSKTEGSKTEGSMRVLPAARDTLTDGRGRLRC